MFWRIIRKNKYETRNLKEDERISLEEWRQLVESDPELIWAENSPIAESFRKAGEVWVGEKGYRMVAYYDINKYKYGSVRFKYINSDRGHLMVECDRQTLKRVEKMWEVAQKLKANLFKNGYRFKEQKLEKLREKYAARRRKNKS